VWDFNAVIRYEPLLLAAFYRTVLITVEVVVFGSIGGVVLGAMQVAPNALLRWLSRILIEILLAVPALVLIIWIYYCPPMFFPHGRGTLSAMAAAVVALSMSLAAFVAVSARAGLQSVPFGQVEAAYCCGLSRWEAARDIVFPQAWRRAWPAIVAQYITAYKLSTLASVVAVDELLHAGSDVIAQTYRPLEVYSIIAVVFCLTTIPINIGLRRVESRMTWAGGVVTL
jgi:polar amino acid transport system permease protein